MWIHAKLGRKKATKCIFQSADSRNIFFSRVSTFFVHFKPFSLISRLNSNVLTSFWVSAAAKSWLKYTTDWFCSTCLSIKIYNTQSHGKYSFSPYPLDKTNTMKITTLAGKFTKQDEVLKFDPPSYLLERQLLK